MKSSFFGNMTPDKYFNFAKVASYDDIDHFTLDCVGDFYYGKLDFQHWDEFTLEYESFVGDDHQLQYNAFPMISGNHSKPCSYE